MTEDPPYFEQNQDGKIAQKYTDQQFISAVEENSPASTSEVSNAVGCTSANAYQRLKNLEEEGRVSSKKAGGSLIWFVE